MSVWKTWKERWNAYLGDRSLELAIRTALKGDGYASETVRIENLRLEAIQRPGWVQVYRFQVTAKCLSDDRMCLLHGLVRDDGRQKSDVRLDESEAACVEQLAIWSEGLIVRRPNRPRGRLESVLIVFAVIAVAVGAMAAMLYG